MDEKNISEILRRLRKLEKSVNSLIKSRDQVVLALIPYKAELEQMIRDSLIKKKELDKRASELLEQCKESPIQ